MFKLILTKNIKKKEIQQVEELQSLVFILLDNSEFNESDYKHNSIYNKSSVFSSNFIKYIQQTSS